MRFSMRRAHSPTRLRFCLIPILFYTDGGFLRALTGQKTRPAGRVFRYREGSPWNINENNVQMEVEWRWQMSN